MLATVLLAPLLSGLAAALLPQDANWDLRNYHYYNPFALLNGRSGFDIAPAQLPSFYNPLLHLPYYWLVNSVPPRLVAFVLGAVQGFNITLLVLLARGLLHPPQRWLAWPVALLGATGAANLSMLGTSFFDNVLSLFFLGSLLVLVRRQGAWPALLAGLVIGIAVGLKQTMVIYAIGLCLGCLAMPGRHLAAFRTAFTFGLGVVGGILLSGGWWMWSLWDSYGNPLFPYMNSVFGSPMAPPTDRRDLAYVPETWTEALLFPFLVARDSRQAGEIAFTDIRLALLYLALPLALLLRARPLLSAGPQAPLLLVACAATYVAWLALFAIYRYQVGSEMLAPLVLLLCLDRLPLGRHRLAAAGAVAAAMLAAFRPGLWERVPWSGAATYFDVGAPAIADPAGSLVLMAGWQPTSFVIPFFPRDLRFIRIQGNFTSPDDEANPFNDLMRALVAGHRGPLFLLAKDHELADAGAALATYRLDLQTADCVPVPTALDRRIVFCPLRRDSNASAAASGASQTIRDW
jgi:hypothetical protein